MSIQDDIARTHGDIDRINQRIAVAEDELARLREELRALHDAEGSVRGDKQTFLRQLGEKRSLVSRAAAASANRCTNEYATAMAGVLGLSFESGVSSEFDGFLGQIGKAIADVEAEVRQKEAEITSLQKELRRLFVQLDEQEQLEAESRAQGGE